MLSVTEISADFIIIIIIIIIIDESFKGVHSMVWLIEHHISVTAINRFRRRSTAR